MAFSLKMITFAVESVSHVTAIFGFMLAGLVIQDALKTSDY